MNPYQWNYKLTKHGQVGFSSDEKPEKGAVDIVALYTKAEFIKLIEEKIEYYKQFENYLTIIVPLEALIKDIKDE